MATTWEDSAAYWKKTAVSSFIYRGTLTFKGGEAGKECLRAHLVGSATDETKLIMDIDEQLFPREKVSALQEDLDFVFGSYEAKAG